MLHAEFILLRYISAKCKRPHVAFAVLVALQAVKGNHSAYDLAHLTDTSDVAVASVGKELEELGIITREWDASQAAGEHGRKRRYALRAGWQQTAFDAKIADEQAASHSTRKSGEP